MYSFADAVVASRFRLDDAGRQASERAAARLSRALALPVAEIPGDLDRLEPLLQQIAPEQVGLKPHSFAMMKSDARRAVRALDGVSPEDVRAAAAMVAKPCPTLADAAAAAKLTAWNKSDIASAVTALERFARKLGRPLDAIPADLAALDAPLKQLSAGDLGVSPSTASPMRSRIRRALRLVDSGARKARPNRLPPEWSAIFAQIESAYPDQNWRRAEIAPLVYFCARHGIEPDQVGDATIAAWIEDHVETRGRSMKTITKAVRAWNSHIDSDKVRLPGTKLQLPRVTRCQNLGLEDLPLPIQNQWQEYKARFTASDDLADCVVDPADNEFAAALGGNASGVELKPGTQRNHLNALLMAATVAVEQGTPVETLVSMEALLTPERIAGVLTAIRKAQEARAAATGRRYEPKNRYRWSVAATLKGMAVKLGLCPASAALAEALGPEHKARWQAYAAIVEKVNPRQGGGRGSDMGERPNERLKQFDDEAKILAWYDLPGKLVARAEALRAKGIITPESIIDVEIAVVARLLRCMPVRRENIAGLTIYGNQPHIRLPMRKGDPAWMYHSAGEVKNHVQLQAQIDPVTVTLIQLWLEHYRPEQMRHVGADPDTPFLFVGRGDRHVNPDKLNRRFRERFQKYAGLLVNLHLSRQIVGHILLTEDITLIELVSLLLGHKNIETTRRSYARANTITAQRRWLEILAERERAIRSQGPRIVPVPRRS